jgi:hypothetical protein
MHNKLPLWLTAARASCYRSCERNARRPERPPGLQADVFASCSAHVPPEAAGDHLPHAGVTAAKASENTFSIRVAADSPRVHFSSRFGPDRGTGAQGCPARGICKQFALHFLAV